ncbi:MAG: hypothetical protein V4657_09445 [Pseudomonadota bacterium]
MIGFLRDPEGRKAAAFIIMFGGAIVMTGYAVAVLIMVRANLLHTFWLGIAAHVQLFALLAGFIGFNIRRTIKAGRDGVEYDDREGQPVVTTTTTTAVAAPVAMPDEQKP